MNKTSFHRLSFAIASAIALNGCLLNDPYDYDGDNGGGDGGDIVPPPKDSLVIYGSGSNGNYQHVTKNNVGDLVIIDSTGNATNENISVTGLEPSKEEGVLQIDVSENNASWFSEQPGGNPVDITIKADSDVMVLNLEALSANDTMVHIEGETDGSLIQQSINITSAMTAALGAGDQTLIVPLSCFNDIDFGSVTKPVSLDFLGSTQLKLNRVSYATPENDSANLQCEVNSLTVEDPIAELMLVTDGEPQGLTPIIGAWLTDGNTLSHRIEGNQVVVDYLNATTGANGGLVLEGNDLLDLSHYAESGWLEFMIHVDSYAAHPTKRLQIQMEGAYGNTLPYFLDEGFAEGTWEQVRVPLNSLFTSSDGQRNFNQIANVKKTLSMFPEWINDSQTLNGITLRIAGVKLIAPEE